MENKFTVTFGQLPLSYINREHISDKICNDFSLDFPLSHIYIISGVRGSGTMDFTSDLQSRLRALYTQ